MDIERASQLLDLAVKEPGIISAAYSQFHAYSFGNVLLAAGQCYGRGIAFGPIKTFPGWKALGRSVRKGEKALTLCQPVTGKRKADADKGETDDVTYTRFVYKPHWFVLSQTEGADVPAVDVPDWQAARALEALQIAEIPFDLGDGNCQGYAKGRSIAVSPIAALPVKTRFHELAHVVLGHTTEGTTESDGPVTPRSLREVEAEAVAMLCCDALGLPEAAESRGYIQHWNRDGMAIPDASARQIFKAVDAILKAGRPVDVAPDSQ